MSGVCVVIPVFGRDDVMTTVPRLLAWHPGLRIVVVDNGNAPERAAKIAALASNCAFDANAPTGEGSVEVVRLEENRGGSGGYIAGMKRVLERHRDCELVWLLDDDAEPNEGTLPGLVKAYEKLTADGERVASVGSAIVRKGNPDVIAECGALYLKSPRGIGISLCLNGEGIEEHVDEINRVEYCSACSCLVPKTALEEVGLWEDVFIHYDDVEWGLRAEHKFGYANFATTMSVVQHPDVTVSKNGGWIQYYDMYNLLWISRLYAPKEFARLWRMARKREYWARLFNLNAGKHYAIRMIMDDFRAGKRKVRAEVVESFAAHHVDGNLGLLARKGWRDWVEMIFPPFRWLRKLYRCVRHHGEFAR